jgi:hypothetical protein
MLTNIALFLHNSIIWMHYLLQKPEGQLTHHIPVRLCKPLLHSGGGVVVYPDFVHKLVRPPLGADKFQPLYDSITLSRYLIHLKHFQALKRETVSQLEPVGNHIHSLVFRGIWQLPFMTSYMALWTCTKQGYTHMVLTLISRHNIPPIF